MIFNQSNLDDIKKYYHQTWVKFPRISQDTIWFIDRVGPEYIEIKSDSGEEALFSLKKDYAVDYVLPGKAVYQFGNNAACLTRIPARMWKKGMSSANTQFKLLTDLKWTPLKFDINVIKAFVNKPAYMDPYAAIQHFKGGSDLLSAAISPRISINRSGSIYIDEIMIGKYEFAKEMLTTREVYINTLKPLFHKTKLKGLSSL